MLWRLWLLVVPDQQTDRPSKGQGHLLSCCGQLKIYFFSNNWFPIPGLFGNFSQYWGGGSSQFQNLCYHKNSPEITIKSPKKLTDILIKIIQFSWSPKGGEKSQIIFLQVYPGHLCKKQTFEITLCEQTKQVLRFRVKLELLQYEECFLTVSWMCHHQAECWPRKSSQLLLQHQEHISMELCLTDDWKCHRI